LNTFRRKSLFFKSGTLKVFTQSFQVLSYGSQAV